MWLSGSMPPQRGPASEWRLLAQLRSTQVNAEEQRKWDERFPKSESKFCGHCGYMKTPGQVCTKCWHAE